MIDLEISLLKQLEHPNIVVLYDDFDMPKKYYLALELVEVRFALIFLSLATNERSEFVVSYESILGISADDVRPFLRSSVCTPYDLENHSTHFYE